MNEYQKVERDLRKYKGLKVFVQNAREQIANLEKDIKGAEAIKYRHGNSKTNAFHSTVETEVVNRDERIEELEAKIGKAEEIIHGIDRALDEVLNNTEKRILTMYYMEGEPWYKIAYEVSISSRHCKRIRNEAIQRLIPAFFGEK